MSYFNKEQEAYMQYLSTIPRDQRCFCGWFKFGLCPTCPKDKTNADKCLTCMGVGNCWNESIWGTCKKCNGTGIIKEQ